MADFSSGLDPSMEFAVQVQPTEPLWTENFLFAGYDPDRMIGFWLHHGSVSGEWSMWEDWITLSLPDDEGLLSMWAYHRTAPERKPAGSNLAFRRVEPFKRFDGFAQLSTVEAMSTGLVPASRRKRLVMDLEVECVSPVWDTQSSPKRMFGKGDMARKSWGKEHYEQVWRGVGSITVDKTKIAFAYARWRDHSRDARSDESLSAKNWGGHLIVGAIFPSGRSIIFSRFWAADGLINLEGGSIVETDGSVRHVEVAQFPRLDVLRAGEELEAEVRWDGNSAIFSMKTESTIWSPHMKPTALGKDLSGREAMYAVNYGTCEWGEEVGTSYLGRSDRLNEPAAPPSNARCTPDGVPASSPFLLDTE